jgi:hypothetical protein
MWPFRPALLAAAASHPFCSEHGRRLGHPCPARRPRATGHQPGGVLAGVSVLFAGSGVVGILPLDGRPLDFAGLAVLGPLAYLSHFLCGLAESGRLEEWNGAPAQDRIPASANAFTADLAATALSCLRFAASRTGSIAWVWFLCFGSGRNLEGAPARTTGTIPVDYVVVLVARVGGDAAGREASVRGGLIRPDRLSADWLDNLARGKAPGTGRSSEDIDHRTLDEGPELAPHLR